MKFAFSRKNLWERTPPSVKAIVGGIFTTLPPQFWLGRKFQQNFDFIEKAQWWTAEQYRTYQLSELKRLCSLAHQHSAYYRRIFSGIGFSPHDLKSVEDLQGLPLLNRDALRTYLHEMCVVSPQSRQVDYTSTGGTSGQPLAFYIGSDRSQIEYAYLISSWQRMGFRLGMPLAVFRGRPVAEDRDGLRHEYDPLLRSHFYSNFHMTDDNMRRYLEHVKKIGPCFLHVYPSSAAALARFLRRSGLSSPQNVQGIIAESEIVYPEQRQLIEETFGCRLFSCYGLTEKVIAAAECENSADYHVWPTYGFFELVDEEGRSIVTPGQRGEIVGTGFINKIVPFLRYRTGDFATYVGNHCDACGRTHPIIRDIRGHRVQETLVMNDGSLVSWTAINMHDDTFNNIRQFQFYQETPGQALLRVIPAQNFGETDKQRMCHNLMQKLDHRLELTIKLVDSIPLSQSGKSIYVEQRIPSVVTDSVCER